jgi:hypothetical protein
MQKRWDLHVVPGMGATSAMVVGVVKHMQNMVFFNIGWMKSYRGLHNDSIARGGSFVGRHGYGYEMYNFSPYNQHLYGYVQVTGSINLERLGGSKQADSIDDVLVVWVANHRNRGTYIVGWYKHATVFRTMQVSDENPTRAFKGEHLGYNTTAKAADATLLPVDSRVFRIPRKAKGGMGQSNIWYADAPTQLAFRQRVLDYISAHSRPAGKSTRPRQLDPHRKHLIERQAVDLVITHYADLGYEVTSVEKDNVGWDLEARLDDRLLRLEVKGLSQQNVLVELTANEYQQMNRHRESYRICVVTEALSEAPSLRRFSFSPEANTWEDDQRNQLVIEEKISARLTLLQ